MEKTLYGDGTQVVKVIEGNVVFEEIGENGLPSEVVTMSVAAFREVVLGWERHQATLSE